MITCGELRRMAETFSTCTSAERASLLVHFRKCSSCRKWVIEGAIQQIKVSTVEDYINSMVASVNMYRKDITDPEVREVLRK